VGEGLQKLFGVLGCFAVYIAMRQSGPRDYDAMKKLKTPFYTLSSILNQRKLSLYFRG